MPPKRATASSKPDTATTTTSNKRSTRSTGPAPDSSPATQPDTAKTKPKAKAKPAPKAPAKKAVTPNKKGKGKGKKAIEVSSSSDEEEEEEEPVKKKAKTASVAGPSSKAKKGKEVVAAPPAPLPAPAPAPVKKAKAPVKRGVPPPPHEPASTSTTPVPEAAPQLVPAKKLPKPSAVQKLKSPKKALTYQEGLKEWFDEFRDKEEERENETDEMKWVMDGAGIEKLFEEMEVSMEGVTPFILAYKVHAKPGTFGSFYYSDFLPAFRQQKINSTPLLKDYLIACEKSLYPASSANKVEYRSFHSFLFRFAKDEGQKTLDGGMAIAFWDATLSPRYPLAKEFVEYTTSLGADFKGISNDVWQQVLEFMETVDNDLNGYTEDDAWPSTLDSFVEWKREKQSD